MVRDAEGEQTLDDLRHAIEQALMEGDQFDEDMRARLQQMAADGQLDDLIEQLIERMQQEDYISIDRPYGNTSLGPFTTIRRKGGQHPAAGWL